jgi:hypothetical protein
MIALHDAMSAASFHGKIALLPNESYHMTIFSGANDQSRSDSAWPEDISQGVSMQECNTIIERRLQAVRLAGDFPLAVRIDGQETLKSERPCSLRLRGADTNAEHNLRVLRDQLAKAYRYHSPDHEQYGFHITLAYTMDEFDSAQLQEYQTLMQKHIPSLVAAAPILELGLAEYCTFSNMHKYNIEKLLRVA